MKALAILAAVVIAGARTVTGDGYIVTPDLEGFTVGYQAGNAHTGITEEVPQGETVERWTRMVTTQRFAGLARKADVATYAGAVIDGLAGGCPGARTTPVEVTTVSGRPAARFRADCPRNPGTGLPETFWLLALAGPNDIHVKQVAFRRVPDAADVRWAEDFIAGTTWCAAGTRSSDCPH